MQYRVKVVVVLLVSILYFPVFAQNIDLSDYVISNWGMEEGLPQSSVNDIIQTRDGYIWLATFGGLVRFDGLNFTTFDRSNSKGMQSDRILSLFESVDGSIWMSSENGFIRYWQNEFKTYELKLDNEQVYSPLTIDEDSEGYLWLSTNSNIFKFEQDSFTVVTVSTNLANTERALTSKSGAILTFEREVYKTFGDSVYKIIDLNGIIDNTTIGTVEFPVNSGTIFIGTNGDGIQKYENGTITSHTIPEFSPYEEIWDFHIDINESLWILGFGGMGIWVDSGLVSVDLVDEIEDLDFNTVLVDNEDNIWLGSAANGLYRLRPSRIRNIDRDEGLTNLQMLSLLSMSNGNYLFSTNCGGVFEWNGSDASVPPVSDYLPNKCNYSIYEDSKNRFWFGSRVLYRTNSIFEEGIEIDSRDGFSGVDIFAITEDSKNNIWIGALNGLFKYDGSNFHRYSVSDGLSYNDVRTIFEDRNGTLWIGTSIGLNRYENGVFSEVVLIEEGQGVQQPYIRAIHEDEDGTMWFGSYGNGLFRLKNGQIDNITVEQGLFDNVVSHIVVCENGNFWMGSNRGISTVNKEELNLLIDGSLPSVSAYSYGLSDGMNTAETNGGFQPNVIKNADGEIYFPTVSGVAIISTENANPVNVNLPVFIEQIRTSTNVLENTGEVSLPFNDAFLEVSYTALNFSNPEKVRFRYKIDGLNDSWVDVEDQRRILFTKIPPGNYTLEIIASNGGQQWSSEKATLNIEVIPPFWQTTWFYTLGIILFLFSGPLFYVYRTRKLIRENELQRKFSEQLIENQENERRRIASELHDGLGQQILVIKNRAELAKTFIENPHELDEELNEIINSAMSSISDVRSISHDLRPVHLEKFGLTDAIITMCEQVKSASDFELMFYIEKIDGAISTAHEINFYRVIQEALNNIIKHSQAEEASITIENRAQEIEAKIWDDGIGFDPIQIDKKSGLGLIGMKERVETLHGILTLNSQPNKGTTLTITISKLDDELKN